MSPSKIALYGLLAITVTIVLTNFTSPVLAQQVLILEPIDDAFVAIDTNDPEDTDELQQLNTGDLEFLKLWYAWDVTENHEKITTALYLKFDLSDVKSEDITNAELKMMPYLARLTNVTRGVDVVIASDNNWQESKITYADRPEHATNATATTIMSFANQWYGWNITEPVRIAAGSEITFVVGFNQIFDKSEEFLTFYSKESSDNIPYLQIDLAESQTIQQTIQQPIQNLAEERCEASGGKYNSRTFECEETLIPSDDMTQPESVPSDDITQPESVPSDDMTQPESVPSDDMTQPESVPSDDMTQPESVPSDDLTPVLGGVLAAVIGGGIVAFVIFRKRVLNAEQSDL